MAVIRRPRKKDPLCFSSKRLMPLRVAEFLPVLIRLQALNSHCAPDKIVSALDMLAIHDTWKSLTMLELKTLRSYLKRYNLLDFTQ